MLPSSSSTFLPASIRRSRPPLVAPFASWCLGFQWATATADGAMVELSGVPRWGGVEARRLPIKRGTEVVGSWPCTCSSMGLEVVRRGRGWGYGERTGAQGLEMPPSLRCLLPSSHSIAACCDAPSSATSELARAAQLTLASSPAPLASQLPDPIFPAQLQWRFSSSQLQWAWRLGRSRACQIWRPGFPPMAAASASASSASHRRGDEDEGMPPPPTSAPRSSTRSLASSLSRLVLKLKGQLETKTKQRTGCRNAKVVAWCSCSCQVAPASAQVLKFSRAQVLNLRTMPLMKCPSVLDSGFSSYTSYIAICTEET